MAESGGTAGAGAMGGSAGAGASEAAVFPGPEPFILSAETTSASGVRFTARSLAHAEHVQTVDFEANADGTAWTVEAFGKSKEFTTGSELTFDELARGVASLFFGMPTALGFGVEETTPQLALSTLLLRKASPGSAAPIVTSEVGCYDGDFTCTWSPDSLGSLANVVSISGDLVENVPFQVGVQIVLLYLGEQDVDWTDCCLEHDRAGFCGGNDEAFAAANTALGSCITRKVFAETNRVGIAALLALLRQVSGLVRSQRDAGATRARARAAPGIVFA